MAYSILYSQPASIHAVFAPRLMHLGAFIRDCGSNLYVGMGVVEIFLQYNRQGRKDIITKLYVNKMDIYGKP